MRAIRWLQDRLQAYTQKDGHALERIPQWVRISGMCSLLFYPLFCLIIMEYFNYKALLPDVHVLRRFLVQVTQFSRQVVFALIVVYLLFFTLWLLVRQAWIATGVLGGLSLLFGFINYMKLKLNGTPFIPMDITLAGTAKELSSYVSIPIPWLFWLALIFVAGWTVLLVVLRTAFPARWFVRLPIAGAILLAVAFAFSGYDRSTRILNKFDMDIFDNVLQTSNYTANGFVSGFTLNVISMRIEEPKGYSQAAIKEILNDYTGSPSNPDAPEFDVILILAESFFDLRKLDGVTYSEDLLTQYDRLLAEENCYSGNIYTIALGGGTVSTEFRILTGLNTDYLLPSGATPYLYVGSSVQGYVSNYKSAGYNTIGLHLYNPNFYSRRSTYPHLGFDVFYGLQDVEDVDYTRGYATDMSTERAIEAYLDQAAETGDPTFLFAVTIENHQPYGENEDNTISVTADALNELDLQALTTYAQGIKDADEMLGALKEYIDNRERPTVLVWFGDHLPTLGETHLPYRALGYYTDEESTENRMQMFHTPFLVYANRPLQQGLFTSKSDNQISDQYLMTCVAASTGFQQTPYMEFLADAMQVLPIYSAELHMDNSLTRQQAEITNAWKLIAYDRLLGKGYSQ